MKLQTTDLMVGDCLQFDGENKKCTVVGVKCDVRYLEKEAIITVMDDSGHWFDKELDCLQPIPLTPELLEKNGWIYDETNKAYLWKDGNYYISIDLHGKTRVYVCNDYILGLPVDCVHELQHALRLCGIEKYIEV